MAADIHGAHVFDLFRESGGQTVIHVATLHLEPCSTGLLRCVFDNSFLLASVVRKYKLFQFIGTFHKFWSHEILV
jgi:hypothetical protein